MVVVGGDAGDGRQKGKSRVNFERTIFFDTRVPPLIGRNSG
jgi:hypothetical protein